MKSNINIKFNQAGLEKLKEEISENIVKTGFEIECPNCQKTVLIHSTRETCPYCGKDFEVNFV